LRLSFGTVVQVSGKYVDVAMVHYDYGVQHFQQQQQLQSLKLKAFHILYLFEKLYSTILPDKIAEDTALVQERVNSDTIEKQLNGTLHNTTNITSSISDFLHFQSYNVLPIMQLHTYDKVWLSKLTSSTGVIESMLINPRSEFEQTLLVSSPSCSDLCQTMGNLCGPQFVNVWNTVSAYAKWLCDTGLQRKLPILQLQFHDLGLSVYVKTVLGFEIWCIIAYVRNCALYDPLKKDVYVLPMKHIVRMEREKFPSCFTLILGDSCTSLSLVQTIHKTSSLIEQCFPSSISLHDMEYVTASKLPVPHPPSYPKPEDAAHTFTRRFKVRQTTSTVTIGRPSRKPSAPKPHIKSTAALIEIEKKHGGFNIFISPRS